MLGVWLRFNRAGILVLRCFQCDGVFPSPHGWGYIGKALYTNGEDIVTTYCDRCKKVLNHEN